MAHKQSFTTFFPLSPVGKCKIFGDRNLRDELLRKMRF